MVYQQAVPQASVAQAPNAIQYQAPMQAPVQIPSMPQGSPIQPSASQATHWSTVAPNFPVAIQPTVVSPTGQVRYLSPEELSYLQAATLPAVSAPLMPQYQRAYQASPATSYLHPDFNPYTNPQYSQAPRRTRPNEMPTGVAEAVAWANAAESKGQQRFASPEKVVAEYFGGSVEATIDGLNKYGSYLEEVTDALVGKVQQLNAQLIQAVEVIKEYQVRDAAHERLLTEADLLSAYYLKLEEILGELPPPSQYFQMLQQQQAPQMPMLPNGMVASTPNQQAIAPQYNPAAIAAQFSQPAYANALQRPEFPGNAGSQPQSFSQALQSVPPTQRWRLIDQMASNGMLRQARLTF